MPVNKTLLPILAPKVPPVLSINNFENAILYQVCIGNHVPKTYDSLGETQTIYFTNKYSSYVSFFSDPLILDHFLLPN